MKTGNQKRLAAKILGVGINRVKLDPGRLNEVKEALTKTDVSALIKSGAMKAVPKRGVSRVIARKRMLQRKKGRQKGKGNRRGKFGARLPRKERWITKTRALRNLLRGLKQKRVIDRKTYRVLYKNIKSGIFRSKRHMLFYLQEKKIGAQTKSTDFVAQQADASLRKPNQ